MNKKYVACPICRELTIPAGGTECERCGWIAKHKTKEVKVKTDNSIAALTIRFYERDKDLREKLRKQAEHNRRSLSQEILYQLEGNNDPAEKI